MERGGRILKDKIETGIPLNIVKEYNPISASIVCCSHSIGGFPQQKMS